MNKKNAIIIGAGPAGLTAAEQLLAHTQNKPIVIKADTYVGGISKTVQYNGNRTDKTNIWNVNTETEYHEKK